MYLFNAKHFSDHLVYEVSNTNLVILSAAKDLLLVFALAILSVIPAGDLLLHLPLLLPDGNGGNGL